MRSMRMAVPAARISSTPSRQASAAQVACALFLGLALAGCATTSPEYHQYVMRGQVLSVENQSLVVCIGERDGAQVGQQLEVVRHVRIAGGPKSKGPAFRAEPVGSARIAELFDEHYARAAVLSGSPQVNDVVELRPH